MALRLRVVSDHRRLLGENSTVLFELGGTIGRSADNDWVLPDPLRYISAHHARIYCRQSTYFLEDLSTNGVFLNDSEQPIGKQGCKLRNGDVLRFGEYHVVVTVDSPAVAHDAVPTRIEELQADRIGQTDLGASLNLQELLVTESAVVSGVHNAYGQAVALAPASARVAAYAGGDDDSGIARRVTKLARAAASRPREVKNGSAHAGTDVQSGLHAFCRGAGIDPNQLPVEAQTRMLQLAGTLFREVLVGLKDLQRLQHEICSRFSVDVPSADDSRPALARSMIEDYLVEMLKQHETRRIDAVQWLRQTTESVKTHENAVTHAMRAAFLDFIGRLDPRELDARFPKTAERWELFAEFYRNLTERPEDQLPHTFVETFATAYKSVANKKSSS
jgi:type VI secretion system FHA domain protein